MSDAADSLNLGTSHENNSSGRTAESGAAQHSSNGVDLSNSSVLMCEGTGCDKGPLQQGTSYMAGASSSAYNGQMHRTIDAQSATHAAWQQMYDNLPSPDRCQPCMAPPEPCIQDEARDYGERQP